MASPPVHVTPAVVITEEQGRQRLAAIAIATKIGKGSSLAGKIEDVLMMLRAHPTLASEEFHVNKNGVLYCNHPFRMAYLQILVSVSKDEDNLMITPEVIEKIHRICPASLQVQVTRYAVECWSNINDGIVEFLLTQNPDTIQDITMRSFLSKRPKQPLKLIKTLLELCPDFPWNPPCSRYLSRNDLYYAALCIALRHEYNLETLFYIVDLLSGKKLSYFCFERQNFSLSPKNAMVVATAFRKVAVQKLNIDFSDYSQDWDQDLESVALVLNAINDRQSVTDLSIYFPRHLLTQVQYSRLAKSFQQTLSKNKSIQSLTMDGNFRFSSDEVGYEATKESLVRTNPVLHALLNSRCNLPQRFSLRELYVEDLSLINCVIFSESTLVEANLEFICLSGPWNQTLLSGTSNLRKLRVSHCLIEHDIHVDSYFTEFLDLVNDVLPKLKTLQLNFPFIFKDNKHRMSPAGRNQITRIASLVGRNVIEELEYRNAIDEDLEMDDIFDALSSNTSLKVFHFDRCLSNDINHRKMMSTLAEKNKTLECIDAPSLEKQIDIGFYTTLNAFGRIKVSSSGLVGFVKLLEAVNASANLDDESDDLRRTRYGCCSTCSRFHKHVTCSRLNVLYGLLQEDPSIWATHN